MDEHEERVEPVESAQYIELPVHVAPHLREKYGAEVLMAKVDSDCPQTILSKKWYMHAAGYPYRRQSGKIIWLHYAVLGLDIRERGVLIDHERGDRLDCRRERLRVVTYQQNNWNRGRQEGGTSDYKGVYLDRRRGIWAANIHFGRETIFIGRFRDEREAALAYDYAALDMYGRYARTNFPSDGIKRAVERLERAKKEATVRNIYDEMKELGLIQEEDYGDA